MSTRATFATARRVLGQLRHDPRTVVLLIAVPSLLLVLFKYVFEGSPQVFDRVGLPMLGIFPFVTMFLVTSIAMVRERTSGTLERLLTTPMHKPDLLAGYALAFGVVALVQGAIAGGIALGPLGLTVAAGIGLVLTLAVLNALLGMALGLFLSAFASTEFQAVQFLPAAVFPQVLLSGLFTPRDQMAEVLRWISNVLPMSYAIDALNAARSSPTITSGMAADLAVVVGCVLAALALGAATLRRRTA
ncbi:MAG TPA: ABC transporter permease [Mycobacteriales bacterium]|nr:ABC transporter permease [Mycobacteriales bacterium]